MVSDDRRARRDELVAVSLSCTAGVLAALALSFLFQDDVAGAWRTAGGLLELAGFSTVALSLSHKLRPFSGRPPLTERIRARLLGAWRWILAKLGREPEGKTVTMQGDVAIAPTVGGEGRISIRPADDAEVDHWIEYLDRELQAVRERVSKVSREHRKRMNRIEGKLKEVRRESRESDRRVEELVERIAVGSIQWEVVGLVWFVLGVAATTWAPDLPFPLPVERN